MTPTKEQQETARQAQLVYAALLEDLRGRQGLGDIWDEIDVDVRNHEIRPAWATIIASALAAAAQEARDEMGMAAVCINAGCQCLDVPADDAQEA